MRNATLLRSQSSAAPPETDYSRARPNTAHLYEPGGEPLREIDQLFNLRRRPGYYNAAEKVALLRRGKQPPHDELLADFAGPSVRLRLTVADLPLLIGDWTWRATANKELLQSAGSWSEVCWQSGKAFDYLEIELPLTAGWKLRRQMLLARDDRFLLLADALIGSMAREGEAPAEPVETRYSSSVPLVDGAKFAAARETREGWLERAGRRRATIIPPAMAEWRCEYCHAELMEADGSAGASPSQRCLALEQAALGRNLYAPLWIDLDPARAKRPVTWRRLTIAENFAIVGRDVAAAYRIQAGGDQWLIYRSLAPAGNRSVLGFNTLKSFVCLRIGAGGTTQKIVEIQ